MANRFVHIELNTDDVSKAKAFYKKLFKWQFAPSKGMPYTMIDTGSKEAGGGLQKKQMSEAPTAWLPYVEVDDVKKTLAKAKKAGAQIVVDFMPLPGTGALGIFVDPTGAALGVWETGKKPRATKKR